MPLERLQSQKHSSPLYYKGELSLLLLQPRATTEKLDLDGNPEIATCTENISIFVLPIQELANKITL